MACPLPWVIWDLHIVSIIRIRMQAVLTTGPMTKTSLRPLQSWPRDLRLRIALDALDALRKHSNGSLRLLAHQDELPLLVATWLLIALVFIVVHILVTILDVPRLLTLVQLLLVDDNLSSFLELVFADKPLLGGRALTAGEFANEVRDHMRCKGRACR